MTAIPNTRKRDPITIATITPVLKPVSVLEFTGISPPWV
jgi:hypothetical protein